MARVRGYLTSQAAKLTPAQILDKVRESEQSLMAAASTVPAAAFGTAPADGEWSAAEVLHHVLTVVGDHSRTIISTIQTGTPSRVRPDRIEHLTKDVSLEEVRDLVAAERTELAAVVERANPAVHLDVAAFTHPEFGSLNWHEALLFVRVHTLDHVRQLQQIASAIGS